MSKWKMVKLGDVCEIQAGGTPSRGTAIYWENGNIPWIKIGDIEGKFVDEASEYITDAGLANSSAKLFPPDTLLYTIFATLGEVAILRVKAATNQAIAGIIIKNRDEVLMEYLFYALCSMKERVNNIGRGVAQNNINLSILKNIEIPLPPLEEQKRIADILDKASNLIDLRKQQLEKMDLLIKSQFIDMFGDPVTNPKGWEVKRIEELCESIFGGGTPSKSHAEYYDGDIPWVTSKDMKSILISDSIDHINDKAVLNSSAKYIPKQSLLMVIRSGILKHTLPIGINTRVVTINQDMKAFIPNANINVWFMFYTFKMHERSLLNNVRAVTADNIEFSIIKNLMIPVPPIDLQNQFAEFVEQVEKQKAVMQKSLEKMEMNHKALMQEYF